MKKIKLVFTKWDFLHSNYNNFMDCAITRALERAGFPEYADTGIGIQMKFASIDVVSGHNKSYKELKAKVLQQYGYIRGEFYEKVEGFEHTLTYRNLLK